MSNRAFIKEELGTFPQFLIYALLEWILIFILFIDGFLAFFASQYAKFFDLEIPCFLCTRLDHVLVRTNPDFYYNESICDSHKKNVSSLAYCHVHKKLSDIKRVCEGCLLSFATEKETDVDTYKSLVGILRKDLKVLIDDERELQLAFPVTGLKKNESFHHNDHITNDRFQQQQRCSCCGELLKLKSEKLNNNTQSLLASPTPSPKVSFNQRTLNLSHIKYTELPKDEESVNTKVALGTPLSNSAQNSPRWPVRSIKKPLVDENGAENEVRLDKKSLMDLYMELDEERSASAIAANNAMAMITRLQEEKAAVQMEALQFQRMMDEQAEYDQEALQSLNDLLDKREMEMKDLEYEIEAYRMRYGFLTEEELLDGEAKPVLDLPVCFPNREEDNSAEESEDSNGVIIEEEKDRKAVLVKEITEITERLNEIETKGELLQQISNVLEVSEGEAILLQISQNLHMLRSFIEMPSES